METLPEIKILYDDDFLQMYYDSSIKSIVKEWKASPSVDKFRILIMQLLAQIIKARLDTKENINLLADCRNLPENFFTEEIINWLNEKVHKLYALNEISKKAFVIKESNSNNSIATYIEKSAESISGFSMKLFDDIDKAKNWLIS